MQFKICYNRAQLDSTVNFIATHNASLLGKTDKIKSGILESIQELVQNYPDLTWIGRDGWYVWARMEEQEGIDNDENIISIEFMVNTAIDQSINNNYVAEYYYKNNHDTL